MDSWCKVLIVEDEYITRQGIRNMIDWYEEGFEIVGEASNGKDAIDMVEKLRPHIVLTDIVMPVMDGLELEKSLRTKFPKIQVVVLSSYSDFDYVRDSFQSGAVDYILKPTLSPANLLKTMKQVASRIPGLTLQGRQNLSLARSIEQLLSGYAEQEAKEQLESAFQNSGFLLVGMDISRIFRQDTAAIEKQKTLLPQILDKLLAEYTYVHLIVNESVLLIVVNFPPPEKEDVYRALRQAMDQIGEQEPRTFYVSSKIFSDISLLKEVYNGPFLSNLDWYFYYKGKHFMAAEEFQKPKEDIKFNLMNYTKLLETLQTERALELLESSVNSILTERSLGEMELKTLVQNAWYQMISVLEDQGLNAENLSYLKRDCLVKIYSCAYSEDFIQLFSILQSDFHTIISKYEVNAHNSTMQSILKYIDNHYNDQLSLASLAKQFNFNYSYLSVYFHSHHSEGFSEYLNRKRINRAMELLRQGTLPVSDVCETVGFTDPSYFTRVFKKLIGTTPRDYRRKFGKTEE